MTATINQKNILALTERKEEFLNYAKKIQDKFNGPSAYFYLQVIKHIRQTKDYSPLFDDVNFIENIYATLTSWGMHRMDKNTRMAEFEDFRNSILSHKERFLNLSGKKIRETNLDESKKDILDLFNSLKIMSRDEAPKFVANSKVMHFLLPDLIPPMDKGHILYFFYGRKSKNGRGRDIKRYPIIKNKEEEYFLEILKMFQVIANKLELTELDLRNKWDTSIPKIIDNAIIGYNLTE